MEVPAKRTPWTTRDLLAAYADAWRAIVGGEPSRNALALLWAQASLECGRDGRPGAFNHNVGNLMAFSSWQSTYHVLRGAPECYPAGKVPAGWREIPASATSIAIPPGYVAALPLNGSRFRAYASLLDGCTDKLRVLSRQWPRAVAALASASGPEDAPAFVAGLVGPPRYFTASATSYAATLRSLATECLRTVGESAWPSPVSDYGPEIDTSPPLDLSVLQAVDFARTLIDERARDSQPKTDPDSPMAIARAARAKRDPSDGGNGSGPTAA